MSGMRSRKDLACTADATAHQRQFVSDLRRRVIDNGEPFAIAQADTPHEIFHTLDIPLISNQWWSAYISAKQLSPRYFAVLDKLGYPGNSCRYCSLGLACTLDDDPATAPWGGLPNPTVLVARLTCECIRHVFGQWAEASHVRSCRERRTASGRCRTGRTDRARATHATEEKAPAPAAVQRGPVG